MNKSNLNIFRVVLLAVLFSVSTYVTQATQLGQGLGDAFQRGVDIAASNSYSIAGTDVISDSSGTATLSNIDALDATTTSTIQAVASGASTALDNLASVAINLPLLPDAAAADDFGSATLPFKDFWFAGSSGTPETNNFQITGASTSGTRVLTFPDATDTMVGKATTDTFTNKTFDANGTGNSLSNVDVADLANGTDGELITWSSSAVATTVAAGTNDQVLTSNGAGAAPTFQTASGGSYLDFAKNRTKDWFPTSGSNWSLSGATASDNNGTTFTLITAASDNALAEITLRNDQVSNTSFHDKNPESFNAVKFSAATAQDGFIGFSGNVSGASFDGAVWVNDHAGILFSDSQAFCSTADGSTQNKSSAMTVTLTDWNDYGVTFNGTTVTCFINGVSGGTADTTPADGDIFDFGIYLVADSSAAAKTLLIRKIGGFEAQE